MGMGFQFEQHRLGLWDLSWDLKKTISRPSRKVDDEPLLGMEFERIYKGVFEMPQTANERDVLSLQQLMQFQNP